MFYHLLCRDDAQYDSSQCEIRAVGEVICALLLAGQYQEEGGDTAEDQPDYGYGQQVVGAKPQAQGGYELDIASADSSSGQDGQQQEDDTTSGCRCQMVQDWLLEQNALEQAEDSERDQHMVEDDLLLEVGEGIKYQKIIKQQQGDGHWNPALPYSQQEPAK